LLRPCGAKIYYETKGKRIPVLLLAPGGMRSSLAKFEARPYNPWAALPESKFQLIGMGQRFANRSTGTVRAGDGWHMRVYGSNNDKSGLCEDFYRARGDVEEIDG